MAVKFREAGIPAEALSAETPRADRNTAQDRLRRREVNVLFVVDLYNEGVDIPELDAVLFLRPTESLTVFLQQLGRGLRLDHGERVPDRTRLRWPGSSQVPVRPALPGTLDRPLGVSRATGRARLHAPAGRLHDPDGAGRAAVRAGRTSARACDRPDRRWSVPCASWPTTLGRPPRLSEFLERTGIDPDDLYRRGVAWSRLVADAGLRDPFHDPDEARLTKGLRRVAHIDDAELIRRLLVLLEPGSTPRSALALDPMDDRRLLMLEFGLWTQAGVSASPAEGLRRLDANPTLRDELRELLAYQLELHRLGGPAASICRSPAR